VEPVEIREPVEPSTLDRRPALDPLVSLDRSPALVTLDPSPGRPPPLPCPDRPSSDRKGDR
jgi:hypothetical protein